MIKARHALHVVLRVVPEIGSLRRREMYRAIRAASITAASRARIRIVHISIQRTHIHLLVEAEDKRALGRGMQGFQISAARHIKAALGAARRGRVFCDRYQIPAGYEPLVVALPRSWLLTRGWSLAGPVSAREVPSRR